jgi:hypothetical protein
LKQAVSNAEPGVTQYIETNSESASSGKGAVNLHRALSPWNSIIIGIVIFHHTCTAPGICTVQVRARFINARVAHNGFKLRIIGIINTQFEPAEKRRFAAPE